MKVSIDKLEKWLKECDKVFFFTNIPKKTKEVLIEKELFFPNVKIVNKKTHEGD